MRKKTVTISDIADKTGYSKTTVSFAFNWPNRISAQAVEKILKCAKDMGYQGGSDLLQDSANRYKTICVLIPEAVGDTIPTWARPMLHLYQQCANHGFMFSMINSKRSSDSFFAKYSAVDAFMFLDSSVDPSFLDIARKRKIPVVGINLDVDGEDEKSKVDKRVDNSLMCLDTIFSLIRTGNTGSELPRDAYTFFEINK
jgi:DNA-binding LacI/PurR family transcriptional regulator